MTPEQIEIVVRHGKNNIIRSVVLMKRAVNNLTFADRSIESIEMPAMSEDIGTAKRRIADALRVLEKYL